MKIRVQDGFQRKQEYKDVVMLETMGPMGMIVVIWIVQQATGLGGFLGTILKLCKDKFVNNIECPFIDEYDCRVYVPLFERANHNVNNKRGVGYLSKGKEYHRVVFVGSPDRLDPDEEDVEREKRFRDACVKELTEHQDRTNGKVTTYVPWDPKKHSKTPTEGGYRALDKIMTDESVADVIKAYMVPSTIMDKDVYKYLQENGMGKLYSRKQGTKKYSDYAQETFGFPGTAGDQTDYEDNNELENGE